MCVCVCVRVCVCVGLGRVPESHRCTVGDVALHIDFTVSDHRAIHREKCFLYGASSKRLWRNLRGHEYVDEYPGEGRESFTAPTGAFLH